MANMETKVKKGGDWKSVVDFDTEASGKGVIKRMAAEDFNKDIKKLIGKDKDEKILQVESFKTPLFNWQFKNGFFHHEYVIFKTKSHYYAVEKCGEGLNIQRSIDKDNVKLKYGRERRLKDTNWEVKDNKPTCTPGTPSKTVGGFLDWLETTEEVHKKYHYVGDNCKNFAQRVISHKLLTVHHQSPPGKLTKLENFRKECHNLECI